MNGPGRYMSSYRGWISATAAIVALAAWVAVEAAPNDALAHQLGRTIAALPHPQAVCGACVIDLKTGQTVFQHSADLPMIPASAAKVFAMSAALLELTLAFQFQTILATDGVHLYVIGDGDPGFGDERLHKARGEPIEAPFDRWAAALMDRGLTHLAGDLVLDESIFDEERIHPTWDPDDLGKWYAAPVGALNYNDNCIDITLNPGPSADSLARVNVQPQTSLLTLINQCRTGGKGDPLLHHPPGTLEYKITGRCTKQWAFPPIAFPDPGLLFGDSFGSRLAQNGVQLSGGIRRVQIRDTSGAFAAHLSIVATHRTPIADVLSRAGKNSQNLFAECLLKRAGYAWARRTGDSEPVGSWKNGTRAVLAMLHQAGVDTHGFRLVDGSGLSRANASTARQLTSLLAWVHKQPFAPILHDCLAEAGVDGSLRRRLTDLDGRVHAKTGTMRGVRTLAGFVDSDTEPRFAFAIMFNGYKGPSTPYKEIQDRFCKALVEAIEQRP